MSSGSSSDSEQSQIEVPSIKEMIDTMDRCSGSKLLTLVAGNMESLIGPARDEVVILLDSSGTTRSQVPISVGMVVYSRTKGPITAHYAGFMPYPEMMCSVKTDESGVVREVDGHRSEALGLAVLLSSVMTKIKDKGLEVAGIVMDSLNWASNMTQKKTTEQMDEILRLLAHELSGFSSVMVWSREGFGEFEDRKTWPPHKVADLKQTTHEMVWGRSPVIPSLMASRSDLKFTRFLSKGKGTTGPDGKVGDLLVGVLVERVGPVRPACKFWLRALSGGPPIAGSVRMPESRNMVNGRYTLGFTCRELNDMEANADRDTRAKHKPKRAPAPLIEAGDYFSRPRLANLNGYNR